MPPTTRPSTDPLPPTTLLLADPGQRPPADTAPPPDEGSLVAEYGLLAVAGAAVCGALIRFAGTDALHSFFTALLRSARGLVS